MHIRMHVYISSPHFALTAEQVSYWQLCTLQHTASHCNTLQHTATHCNTLQHTATHWQLCTLYLKIFQRAHAQRSLDRATLLRPFSARSLKHPMEKGWLGSLPTLSGHKSQGPYKSQIVFFKNFGAKQPYMCMTLVFKETRQYLSTGGGVSVASKWWLGTPPAR